MNAGRGKDQTEAQHGFALLVVLWFLVLIAAIGTYLMANARSETAIARNVLSAARAEALADAGIAQAVFNLTAMSASNRWNLDGVPHRLPMPAGQVIIRVHDETAKINPQYASDVLMSALFEVTGVERARSQSLGAAIVNWIASASESHPFGTAQYREAENNYPPPSVPLETIDELQLVPGMTPDILNSVRTYFTVYTQSDRPNVKNASELVRQAIALAARKGNDTTNLIDSPAYNSDVPADGESTAKGTPTATMDKPEERIVEIDVRALEASGAIFVRHAVLKIDMASPTVYVVLDWRRADSVE